MRINAPPLHPIRVKLRNKKTDRPSCNDSYKVGWNGIGVKLAAKSQGKQSQNA